MMYCKAYISQNPRSNFREGKYAHIVYMQFLADYVFQPDYFKSGGYGPV